MPTSRERFTAACSCEPVDRPPLWIMRQAGRYLPEYRKLKESHSFVEMVRTPALATEVTLQPLKRFPLDAAILFSDILVIPEALGQPYRFKDGGGIAMDFKLEGAEDIAKLDAAAVRERLDYVPQALNLLRAELPDTALLGFCGSPWTLACYMVEGGGSEHFQLIKALFHQQPQLFAQLMDTLVEALVEYCTMQIEAGVDAIQIFDSWAGACPGWDLYKAMSLDAIERVIARLPADFPVILFARRKTQFAGHGLEQCGARVLGVDWQSELAQVKRAAGSLAVQGNLDPGVLAMTPDITRREAERLFTSMNGHAGYIVNLGHGIRPDAKIECVETLVQTNIEFPWK